VKGSIVASILGCSLVVGAVCASPMAARLAVPNAMVVGTEHIAHKVQPTTAVGPGTGILLEGARRSYEAAQVVVYASGSALSSVNMTAGALSDGAGHAIAASNVTFFRQAFIDFAGVAESEPGNEPVPENSPTGDPNIPDPLIPFTDPYTVTTRWVGAPFDVAANRNQPVWVDFYIPESTAAGTYTGAITVTATGQPAVVVPVTLTVWDLVLPDMRVVTTYFASYFEEVIYYHRDTYDCSGGSCWIDWEPHSRLIVKRYQELAHAHRIDTGPYLVLDPGNGCSTSIDWDEYDAAIQPYMDGSYWSDGVPSTWTDAPFSPGVDWGLEADCTDAQYTALASAWAAHLKDQSWFTRTVVYAYDEPPPEAYAAIAADSALMQDGDADWKAQIMDTTSAAPSTGILTPALGIFCQCLRCYDHWHQNQEDYGRAEWPALFAQGIDLWFYESNAQSAPYPTFATNTLLGVEPRIIMWGSWYEYASGFLLWDTVAWTRGNPWGPNVFQGGKSGDGVLMYPGHHDGILAPEGSPSGIVMDGPIPSYRLKVIRQGLQDWALFRLADERGFTDYARSQVARVYGQFGGCDWSGCPDPVNGEFYWLTDATLMDQVRHNIAMKILGILNVAPYVPSIPNPADGAVTVFTNQALRWQGGDPDGDLVTYTVAFGTAISPAVVANVTQMLYKLSLITDTTYYWQITATDGLSTTVGPMWQFTTVVNERRVYLPIVMREC
jgi:hypothetical protein